MLNDLQKIIAMLKKWDLKVDVREQYFWRFALQKLTYMIRSLGFSVGYCHNLYLQGPYSPSLTRDYYDYAHDVLNLETPYVLSEKESQIADKLAMMLTPSGRISEDVIRSNLSVLESTATALYLWKEYPELSEDDIFSQIKQLKPYLKDSVITIGINKVKELLFKPEYQTEDLRREFDEWDKIDAPRSS